MSHSRLGAIDDALDSAERYGAEWIQEGDQAIDHVSIFYEPSCPVGSGAILVCAHRLRMCWMSCARSWRPT